ncbi:MAG: hypothetical protein F4Y07_13385 [Gemmatimonadetes bacterium]|nr:hypothetical protein [Gemmatimonadota bacterium]MYE17462.1 hypothetical protein [Gemmatimonadota bacterium]MYG22347.1 hypothetical protein [Gemmatimonadota bacterium]MYJ37707.1 hypothetical protein [Gemmatimonadota bacterium]
MMDHRDDWPDGILEGDLDANESLDAGEREAARRIARDMRNMNALLEEMAVRASERIPTLVKGLGAPALRRPAWKRWTLAPLAAAAAVAALILVRGQGTDQSGGLESSAGAPPTTNMMAELDVEADKPFVVFPTSDPDIAVVWLLNPKESD